ncbi:MAG: transglutaminase family protein [Erythrobacter sp.]
MTVNIKASFTFEFEQPTSALLQFEAADLPEQEILDCTTNITPTEHFARVGAQENIGERIWIRGEGLIEVDYTAKVQPRRELYDLAELSALSPHELPGEAVSYLLDSRYCPGDEFQSLVMKEFGDTSGGARIAAIRDWIYNHFTYAPGSSDPSTNATESFVARQGICRDFAHVLVTMARASTIPARYVACFAPGVEPPDFHALAEVFLADPELPGGGTWQIVDATGMADLNNTVKIGVGRDAADVSFITSFAPMNFRNSNVEVSADD